MKFHANLETRMAKHGGKFIAGDELSIADFAVIGIHTCTSLNPNVKVPAMRDAFNECLAKFPLVRKWLASMAELFADYIEKRPATIF